MSSSTPISSTTEVNEICKGGYDYDFVNGPSSDDFTCLICTLVAREAQQASCCGKLFCKYCVETLTTTVEYNIKCPNCREDLLYQYFPDRRATRDINQLKVYCDNKEEGCKWSGELREVEAHHDSCPDHTVQCPKLCSESMKRMDLPQHLQVHCPNRQIECTHCGRSGMYISIRTNHLEECPDIEIDCPNTGCHVKPKRNTLEAHRQQCPKEAISCEYADLGCEHVCLREDVLQHNAELVQVHLQLAANEARRATKAARIATNEVRTICTLLESRAATPQGHILKMTTFFKFKQRESEWYSPPFYIFPGGYKMCLNVDAGGNGDGEGTHTSVFLYLMAGENDEILEWPMRGEFSIELLNQERDGNHKQHSVPFADTQATAYNSKVDEGRASTGYGKPKFVSHEDLGKESLPPHTQYVKDYTLYFRVTMTKVESKSKPWLAGAIA